MSSVLTIRSEGSKKQKKHGFSYLSKKEFKELQKKEKDIKVVGTTKLKTIKAENRNEIDTYLTYSSKEKDETFYFKATKPKKCFKRGYICVGDKKYVSYSIFGLPALLIVLLLVLFLCFFLGNDGDGKIELDDFKPIDLSQDEPAVQTKTYDFQTQGSYSVSADKTKIKVWNPETNTRIFKYNVYVDGELLAETQGITPGNMVEIDCSSLLDKKGEHDLVLDLSVLNEETEELVGQAQRNAILTIN